MKLLIVNDEEIVAETMKKEINWKLYGVDEVLTSYSADSARRYIAEGDVDIMLCDIEMPGENGVHLLRWVRENIEEIECIFLTCHANFDYARAAIELNCQDYLLLPAKYETIGETVKKVVERIMKKREDLKYLEFGRSAIKEKVEHALEVHGEKLSQQEIIDKTVSYILENLGCESLSVQAVSDQLYLHPYYLNRIFKKNLGTSISQYIISQRMKMAAQFIKEKKLSANAIAEEVGYKNYSNFHMAFKKYFGCSPTKFKE